MHEVQTRFLYTPPAWQAEVWYCDAEQTVHDAQTRFLASPPSWQAEVWYCDAEQAAHALQLPDVRVPPEVLFLLTLHPAQLASVYTSRISGMDCQLNLMTARGRPTR